LVRRGRLRQQGAVRPLGRARPLEQARRQLFLAPFGRTCAPEPDNVRFSDASSLVSHRGDSMPTMFSEADRELAQIAATQHSIFTRDDAVRVDLTDDQVDYRVANFWVTIHEGVYRMPGAPESWKGRLLAACYAATDPAGISHRSGGALFELPGGRYDLV